MRKVNEKKKKNRNLFTDRIERRIKAYFKTFTKLNNSGNKKRTTFETNFTWTDVQKIRTGLQVEQKI